MNLSRIFFLLLGLPGLTLAQDCAEVEDDAQRLACYDTRNEAPSPVPAEPQASPAPIPTQESQTPEAGPEPGANVVAESVEDFGKDEPIDLNKEYIEATIVAIRTVGMIEYFRLDNGQVWREVEDSGLRLKEGRKVTITEGILESFDLKMEGYNQIIKVRRYR